MTNIHCTYYIYFIKQVDYYGNHVFFQRPYLHPVHVVIYVVQRDSRLDMRGCGTSS